MCRGREPAFLGLLTREPALIWNTECADHLWQPTKLCMTGLHFGHIKFLLSILSVSVLTRVMRGKVLELFNCCRKGS